MGYLPKKQLITAKSTSIFYYNAVRLALLEELKTFKFSVPLKAQSVVNLLGS